MSQDFACDVAVAVIDWPCHVISLQSFNELIPNRRLLKSVTTSQALPKVTCASYLEASCLEKLGNLLNRECICSLKCRLRKLVTLMYQNRDKRNKLNLEDHSGWKCRGTVVFAVFLGCPTAGQLGLPEPEGLKLSGWALAQSICNGKCRTYHSKYSFSAILTWFCWKSKLKLEAWSRLWVLSGLNRSMSKVLIPMLCGMWCKARKLVNFLDIQTFLLSTDYGNVWLKGVMFCS